MRELGQRKMGNTEKRKGEGKVSRMEGGRKDKKCLLQMLVKNG